MAIFLAKSILLVNVSVSLFFGLSNAAHAESAVGTYTEVNLLGTPDDKRASGVNPSISSFTSTFGSSGQGDAFASATGTSVKAEANSKNVGLSNGSLASSFFRNSFTILGNSGGVDVPLIFNFSLTGSMETSTAPKQGGSVASVLFDYKLVNYDDNFNIKESKGNVVITEQGGVPVYFSQSGNMGLNKRGATVTPSISIGGDTNILPEAVLQQIGIPLDLLGLPALDVEDLTGEKFLEKYEQKTQLLDGLILNALSVGIPSLSILPGVKADIGYSVAYTFDSTIQLPQIIRNKGRIDVDIIALAKTSILSAEAKSDFGSTFKLSSISVPNNFTALDLNDLQVLFESGEIIPVTREADITPPDGSPDPIPTPALLPGLIGLALKMRHRKMAQNSTGENI